MQDRCLLICTTRSLNSFRYHSVVNSGVVLFSTASWMGYIHSVADVYVVTRGESCFTPVMMSELSSLVLDEIFF